VVITPVRDPTGNLLGFAKAEQIDQFVKYNIASFDSTSPLVRAFKDETANYYLEDPQGGLEYHTAIRIPQAIENPKLLQAMKKGILRGEDLQIEEAQALRALRQFDVGKLSVDSTVDQVAPYHISLARVTAKSTEQQAKHVNVQRERLVATLKARPWKRCSCAICRQIGIEVIIFRSSNRNKRRGIHNLGVYYAHLKNTLRAHQ